mmetsp:Transcript_16990/g.21181  ORF Transcript_16990/g.21181 Transcript_16990/m.21181 type:complete len:103 (-) Transcript_16990:219-527(-)
MSGKLMRGYGNRTYHMKIDSSEIARILCLGLCTGSTESILTPFDTFNSSARNAILVASCSSMTSLFSSKSFKKHEVDLSEMVSIVVVLSFINDAVLSKKGLG